ncbi:TPR-like protein [Mycena rebaudengoi]|nr:TPR-like protein [Mycena rebaudengoi]
MDTIWKLKLEAIEDDKAPLARFQDPELDLDSSSDSDTTSSDESDFEDVKVKRQPEEDVKIVSGFDGGFDTNFDRLIHELRSTDGASTTGILSKEWDFSVHEQLDIDLRSNLRTARRRKGTARARMGMDLSPQIRTLIGEGNQAYVDGDIAGAIRIMLDVIRIEPRAAGAWTVLAQCYDDKQEPMKGLQLRIMGAHLKNDADEWDRLARQSKELGYGQQALYCWGKGYTLDPTNTAALWDRAMLARELGYLKTTRNALLGILAQFPHDLDILRELRAVLIELSELETCTKLFQEAFDHYQDTFPSGVGRSASSGLEVPGAGFALLEILILADLHNTSGEHKCAIEVIRRGCRWLQGRKKQSHWDLCTDDREFDLPGCGIVRPDLGTKEIDPGCYELDVNARHRLAIARIKMGDIDEGKIHTEVVLAQDMFDYAPLFTEIADSYFERDLFADARGIYELLGANEVTSSVYILHQTAACMRMADELQEAADVYEYVRKADPTNNEAKMKLAEIYELQNKPRKALELVYEVIDSRKRGPNGSKQFCPVKTEPGTAPITGVIINDKQRARPKANRLSNAELRELEARKESEVIQGYLRLKQLWPRMLKGYAQPKQEWLLEAEKLTDTFRETRSLFSTSRTFKGIFPGRKTGPKMEEVDEDRILSRLQLDVANASTARKTRSGDKYNRVDVFRGVGFDDWLRIFIQYSFVLTENGDYDRADEVLRHILVSSAYQLPAAQNSIRVALITCATTAGRFPVIIEQSRKLMTLYQFHNEPIRILMAALGSGHSPSDAFLSTTFQKYLNRELRIADAAVNNPDHLVLSSTTQRFSLLAKSGDLDEEDDEMSTTRPAGRRKKTRTVLPDIAKKPNPIMLAMYGQMCLVSKSFQSAIFYLLMAYDYCRDDPVICLSLAVASIGRGMQRQCDNRQHLIVQAMGFMSRYRNLRAVDGDHVVEVEFNFGRLFHQLGLYSHAARHYERALESATKNEMETECLREAAYNLSMIYVATGAQPLAIALYRRWLLF